MGGLLDLRLVMKHVFQLFTPYLSTLGAFVSDEMRKSLPELEKSVVTLDSIKG
jgi:hypothetical protein